MGIATTVTSHYSTAKVTSISPQGITLSCGQGDFSAIPALSCVLTPAVGDLVLCLQHEEQCFILQVVHRSSDQPAVLDLPAGAQIKASGNLSIQSSEQLSFYAKTISSTADQINTNSQELLSIASNAKWLHQHQAISGQRLDINVTRFNLVSDLVRLTAKQLQRFVSQLEFGQISNSIMHISKNLISRSRHQTMTASGEMKVDAKRIHMG